jgi:hypothetical protein
MIEFWIAGSIAITAFLFAVAGLSVGFHLYKCHQKLQEEISVDRNKLLQLENDLSALCIASVGEGEHVGRLEKQMRSISDRQDALDLRVSTEQPYDRASQLAQDGASVDDIVNSCGLTRAEAELVIMLHGACGRG